MNKDLFDSMQEQMKPSPEVRAALSENLARPAKRRIPVRKYVAVAACAAVVIGGLSVYRLYQDPAKWMLITQNFHHDVIVSTQHLHSYVTVEDPAGYGTESTGALSAESGVEESYHPFIGDRGSGAPNTGDLPSGDIENDQTGVIDRDHLIPNTGDPPGGNAPVPSIDVPVQEGAEDYQALMAHFNGALPDWYGGGYLDESGQLVVLLTQIEDSVNNPLKLQIQEWAGSDRVRFGPAKYSLNHLKVLMDRLNQLPDADLKYADVMAGWGIDEEHNRVELTLTQVYEPLLIVLAELDPEDDAIYVRIGQRAAAYAGDEDPALILPGGAAVPEDDENLIAYEPYYDGSGYDLEHLPAEEENRPATTVQSVPEEDVSTSSYNPGA